MVIRAPFLCCKRGFTLIELLVALAIIATLLSIVVPRYFGSISKAQEATLHENLRLTRDALDKFYADSGRYPDTLQELVDRRYLRDLPIDPIAESRETWVLVPPQAPAKGKVFNIRSSAQGAGSDGKPYAEW